MWCCAAVGQGVGLQRATLLNEAAGAALPQLVGKGRMDSSSSSRTVWGLGPALGSADEAPRPGLGVVAACWPEAW